MKYLSILKINCLLLLTCLFLLAMAFYLQFIKNLAPCPLCILQRIAVGLLALVMLIAILHRPKKRLGNFIYASLAILISLLGIALAWRQVYLQHLPLDANNVCLPGLDYMLQVMPLGETLKLMFLGTDNCQQIVWTFLGLSTPNWVLIFFVMFLLINILQFVRALLIHHPRAGEDP